MDAAKIVIIDVERCARCGGDHEGMEFEPFFSPPDPKMTHYAFCPTNNEPILMGPKLA